MMEVIRIALADNKAHGNSALTEMIIKGGRGLENCSVEPFVTIRDLIESVKTARVQAVILGDLTPERDANNKPVEQDLGSTCQLAAQLRADHPEVPIIALTYYPPELRQEASRYEGVLFNDIVSHEEEVEKLPAVLIQALGGLACQG